MPDRHKLKLGFRGNLTTRTVEVPAGEARPWDADSRLSIVGKGVPRIQAHLQVSGKAKYTFDINLPGMLHAAVLRSPHACAIVKSIDTSRAEKQPGVKAVYAVAKPGDRMIFAGQDVAAVAAESPEQARDALHHIEVAYDAKPFVVDTLAALEAGAPSVHARDVKERRTEGDDPDAGGGKKGRGNRRPTPPKKKGDIARGFRGAPHVHEATYATQVQTHSCMETHGIVVRWDSKKTMTAWSSTQGIFGARDDLAKIFDLKPGDVHVITEFMGGGFGSKFGASPGGTRLAKIAGELAREAGAPVKLMLGRQEDQECTGNRPDSHQVIKLAADRRGRLKGIHVVAHGTAGVGTGAGIGNNAFVIYSRCPNRLVESTDVFTHAGPGAAMRGPGHPQGAFAIELAMDELAKKIGMDPVELRLANDRHPLRLHQLDIGRERFGWKEARERSSSLRDKKARIRRGYGVAASIWPDLGRAKAAVATVSVQRDGTIEVRHGVQDIGGGIPTIMAQVAAEVFGRPLETVTVRFGTSEHGSSVASGGSLTTASVTPAVRNAAEQARAELSELAGKLLGADKGKSVTWDGNGSASLGGKTMTFDQVCKKMEGEAITATATRPRTYGYYPMQFSGRDAYEIGGIQFAEVEVDTWTGIVHCKKILALHDCGRVMNELTATTQTQGGIAMGLGYALTEERIMDPESGRMLNANLESYKIAGFGDCPEVDLVFTEVHTGNNNTGAIGLGEPATIPTAAAIANAVFDAIGVPIRSLPITPDKVLAALGAVPEQGGRASR
jgi:xanthine dehydrogenase YagR molybdenum-binding subunit